MNKLVQSGQVQSDSKIIESVNRLGLVKIVDRIKFIECDMNERTFMGDNHEY